MRAHRLTAVLAGTAAIAVAGLLVASPASAATLPDGQRISVVGAVDPDEGALIDTTYTASPVDASLTAVGSDTTVDSEIFGMDVNDDGVGFALAYTFINGSVNPTVLSYDANTGVFSNPQQIVPTGDEVLDSCLGIDLQPNGEVLVTCVDRGDGGVDESYIGVVDPTNGDFTAFIINSDPGFDWSALAYDAKNAQLWAFTTSGSFLVDRAGQSVGIGIPFQGFLLAADFDRDGQLFVTLGTGLATLAPSTGAITNIGPYMFEGETQDVESITVWGRVALPATGPADLLPIGLGTALLFLAGAAFVATNRIQRRAE